MHLNFILVPLFIFLGLKGLDWLLFLFYHKKCICKKQIYIKFHVEYSVNVCCHVKSTVLVYKLDPHRKSGLHTKHKKKQNHFWFFICLSLASDSTCIFIELIASWYTISWWRYETCSRELAHSLLRPYLSYGWNTHTHKQSSLFWNAAHPTSEANLCLQKAYLKIPH